MFVHVTIPLVFLLSVNFTAFSMDKENLVKHNNPYRNPTTQEEVVLKTEYVINKLLEELKGTKGSASKQAIESNLQQVVSKKIGNEPVEKKSKL